MSLISDSRCRPGAEDVVEVLLLPLVQLAEHPLGQHLGEADDGVQRRPQLVGHVGQELALVLACLLQLAALLFDLARPILDFTRPIYDLLFEVCVRLLKLGRHGVELIGERLDLIAGSDLDSLVQRPFADASCARLQRLERGQHATNQQHTGEDGRHQPQEQEECRSRDGLANRRERSIEGLVDENDPARRLDDSVGDEPIAGAAVDPLIGWIELRHDHDRGRERIDNLGACKLLPPLKRTKAHRADLRRRREVGLLTHQVRIRVGDQASFSVDDIGASEIA